MTLVRSIALLALTALVGCQSKPMSEPIRRAQAQLEPTKGHQVRGKMTFLAADGGVRVIADMDGLTPGLHGMHIHEKGDCSAPDAKTAGEHYNPTNKRHGGSDAPEHHVGDLGNILADASGHGHYDRLNATIQLNGPRSIVGLSVLVHADPDDLVTQPGGKSGDRVACGVIKPLSQDG
jgi:superoxide dismutase, Cu-Zn family